MTGEMSAHLYRADVLTRQGVTAGRDGWVTEKAYGSVIGHVSESENVAGEVIWRAQSGDIGAWATTRKGAVAKVIDLHNMQVKARSYDLIAGREGWRSEPKGGHHARDHH